MLWGSRYVERGASRELVQFLQQDQLAYLDFDETVKFYEMVQERHVSGKWGLADLALLGCNDRYFLLTGLCGRVDALHPWLFDRCREVEADPDGHLDLWARYHYKSTIITYAGTIQDIVRDPDMTQCIFSVTRPNAIKFLAQIKDTLERNQILKAVYSDCLWDKPRSDAPRWSLDKGIEVIRSPGNTKKEATVEAWGLVEGLPAGPHFEKLLYDDTVTQKSVTNEEMIEKVNMHEQLSDNLGIGLHTRKQYVGTRYRMGDTYQQIIDRGDVKLRIYPATENGKLDGKPVFLLPEAWEKVKKTQKKVVAAQHLMNPAAGNEASFDPRTFNRYDVRPSMLNVYIMGDPSRGMKGKKSDRTAIAVIGVDSAGNKYLLDGFRHRMKLTERWKRLHELYRKWLHMPGVQNVEVGWERYGLQTDLEYFEERMMEPDSLSFPIEELAWPQEGDHSKKDRVERLEPDLRNGNFFLPAIVWHPNYSKDGKHAFWSVDDHNMEISYKSALGETRNMIEMKRIGTEWRNVKPIIAYDEDKNLYDLTRALIEELRFFPFGMHDDLVDATSRIYDMDYAPAVLIDRAEEELEHFEDT